MKLAFSQAKTIVAILVIITSVVAWFWPPWSLIPLGLLAYVFYFFRDPQRQISNDDNLILAPADGKVTRVATVDCPFVGQGAHQISIFMSPFDVHINRSPIAGVVEHLSHQPGKFLPAMNPDAPLVNEKRNYHVVGRVRIKIVQIAGIMARRTVCWVGKEQRLAQGEKIGMVKFGSCTQVTFPGGSKVVVAEGDRVQAGLTIIGEVDLCKE